ncbi:MAG: ECF transporter S component [Candidatus Bathyarchaeia archaeon]
MQLGQKFYSIVITILSAMSKETPLRRGYWLTVFGGLLIASSSLFEAAYILHLSGYSLLQEFRLLLHERIFVSLCLFLGLTAAALAFAGAYFQLKGFVRLGGFSGVCASVFALFNVMVPFVYGFEVYQIFAIGTVLGVCLIAVGAEFAGSVLGAKWRGPLLTSQEVAVVAVLSAVYAALIVVVKVPSPTGGYTHVGDLVVFAAALLFGYKVGGLVGVVGAVAADFYVGYERWFVSILAHGLEGLIPGLAKGKPLAVQALACVVGGFLMATTYFIINVFIKGYPVAVVSYMRDLFVQAGVSIVAGLAIVKVVRSAVPQLR